MQITPTFFQLELGSVNAFLALEPEPLLIDTGMPGRAPTILASLAEHGLAPDELGHIVLTHHDADHIGSALAVKAATGATVYAHRLDAPCIAGTTPRKPWLKHISARLFRAPTFSVDVELMGGETIGGWQILHTPGHSPGHISLYRPPLLVTGDLLRSGDTVHEMFRLTMLDPLLARESIRPLLNLDFDILVSAHGGPTYDAKPKLKALVDAWQA